MTFSRAIDAAVASAEAEGNAVSEISTGWTKVREVVHMQSPMTDVLRSLLERDFQLRYWSTQPTPHNKAEEGFTDDTEKVAISFPR